MLNPNGDIVRQDLVDRLDRELTAIVQYDSLEFTPSGNGIITATIHVTKAFSFAMNNRPVMEAFGFYRKEGSELTLEKQFSFAFFIFNGHRKG
jgi:hypothetical protein